MACKPKCDPAKEAISSEIDNLVLSFFGAVTKTCVNGKVAWSLPCDLNFGVPGFPRLPNEGVACYLIRYVQAGLVIGPPGPPGPAGPAGGSPLTTKGDIFGHSTVDARIPVGANNDILIADSTQALGVKWAGMFSVDTASNLGAGNGVFSSKVGNDFQFKSLIAGTNITLTPTGSDVKIDASLPAGSLSEYFESTGQTITAAGALTIPHGLTGIPLLSQIILECTTNDANSGMLVGDQVFISPQDLNSGGTGYGVSVVPDATNLNIRFGNGNPTFSLLNTSTGVGGQVSSNANFNIIFRVWR